MLSNAGGDAVYRWTLEGGVLSLTMLEIAHQEEAGIVRLMMQHDFRRVDG